MQGADVSLVVIYHYLLLRGVLDFYKDVVGIRKGDQNKQLVVVVEQMIFDTAGHFFSIAVIEIAEAQLVALRHHLLKKYGGEHVDLLGLLEVDR